MIQIQDVTENDLDTLLPLLRKLSRGKVENAVWRRFFTMRFKEARPNIGLMAVQKGEPVAFLGTIYARRQLNGLDHEFCNISGWIVDNKTPGAGLMLLSHLLKEKDVTYTSFSANPISYPLLKRFGFQFLSGSFDVYPFTQGLFAGKVNLIFEKETILSKVASHEKKLVLDHDARGQCAQIEIDGASYLCIMTKVKKKRLDFMQVHYFSATPEYHQIMTKAAHQICRHFRASGIIRFGHEERSAGGCLQITSPSKAVFRSEKLEKDRIDSLYSEYFIMS